jgi:hypothetical protein
MKLLSHSVSRDKDRILIQAAFRDRMRRPAWVSVSTQEAPGLSLNPVWTGDATEVMGLFGGLAEIAWAMGWRPRGLDGRLLQILQTFKIPSEEK